MNKLLQYKYALRQNLMALIGVCLCFYFAYHIMHGDRSIIRLIHLSQSIETESENSDIASNERAILESRVVMMRPGSINGDLLEEQVRLVLGYKHTDELIIVSN